MLAGRRRRKAEAHTCPLRRSDRMAADGVARSIDRRIQSRCPSHPALARKPLARAQPPQAAAFRPVRESADSATRPPARFETIARCIAPTGSRSARTVPGMFRIYAPTLRVTADTLTAVQARQATAL